MTFKLLYVSLLAIIAILSGCSGDESDTGSGKLSASRESSSSSSVSSIVSACHDKSSDSDWVTFNDLNYFLETRPTESAIVLNWEAVSGATEYNLYWNTEGNVTTADNKIPNVIRPYKHRGLTNGVEYFYVLVAVGERSRSLSSTEVYSTPLANPAEVLEIVSVISGAGPGAWVLEMDWSSYASRLDDDGTILWEESASEISKLGVSIGVSSENNFVRTCLGFGYSTLENVAELVSIYSVEGMRSSECTQPSVVYSMIDATTIEVKSSCPEVRGNLNQATVVYKKISNGSIFNLGSLDFTSDVHGEFDINLGACGYTTEGEYKWIIRGEEVKSAISIGAPYEDGYVEIYLDFNRKLLEVGTFPIVGASLPAPSEPIAASGLIFLDGHKTMWAKRGSVIISTLTDDSVSGSYDIEVSCGESFTGYFSLDFSSNL